MKESEIWRKAAAVVERYNYAIAIGETYIKRRELIDLLHAELIYKARKAEELRK